MDVFSFGSVRRLCFVAHDGFAARLDQTLGGIVLLFFFLVMLLFGHITFCYRLHTKRTMNPSRFGIVTLGSVLAFISSFSPMGLLSARMQKMGAENYFRD